MRNAECGIDRATVEPRSELAGSTSALQFRIPHSALRIRGGAGAVRVVLQRVSRAEVRVSGRVTGKIGVGFLVLAGFAPSDTADTLAWMADKLLGLRVFGDAEGKMNLALADVGGAVLVVSQFTLYGDATKRSEEHTSELQSRSDLVCRLLLEKKKKTTTLDVTTLNVRMSLQERHAA